MKQRDKKDSRDARDATPRKSAPSVPTVPLVPSNPDGYIPPHGGYEALHSYQKAQIVFDATVYFCRRFLEKKDRTYDQMVQAARSGKQNIREGSIASATSKQSEIHLTNVARGSQEELEEDYKDFLRTRGLHEWPEEHRYSQRLRALNRTPGTTCETFRKGIESENPEIAANVLLGLVRVTMYLLKRQVAALEKDFLENGGIRERMTKARLKARERQQEEERRKDGKDRKD